MNRPDLETVLAGLEAAADDSAAEAVAYALHDPDCHARPPLQGRQDVRHAFRDPAHGPKNLGRAAVVAADGTHNIGGNSSYGYLNLLPDGHAPYYLVVDRGPSEKADFAVPFDDLADAVEAFGTLVDASDPAPVARVVAENLRWPEPDEDDAEPERWSEWENGYGIPLDPDDDDVAEGLDAAAVLAAELRDRGCTEPSSSRPLSENDWWSSEPQPDRHGTQIKYSVHVSDLPARDINKAHDLAGGGPAARAHPGIS